MKAGHQKKWRSTHSDKALTTAKSENFHYSRSSSLDGGKNVRLDIGPLDALAPGFKHAAQPRLFVHDDKYRAVNEEVRGILAILGFYFNRRKFQAVHRQRGDFPFGTSQKRPTVQVSAETFRVVLQNGRRVVVGSVVSVTSFAGFDCVKSSCSDFICCVMRGHGPAQRVKMMSAIQT